MARGSENLESEKDCTLSPRTKEGDAEAESSRGAGAALTVTAGVHDARCAPAAGRACLLGLGGHGEGLGFCANGREMASHLSAVTAGPRSDPVMFNSERVTPTTALGQGGDGDLGTRSPVTREKDRNHVEQ